jgi:hypothetical protein
MKVPIAGRAMPWLGANGLHSQTTPWRNSSQESHVLQGVPPPAQFHFVPPRIRYAAVGWPFAAKRIAEAPPRVPLSSLFVTSTQPPLGVANVAAPSGCPCQT